MDKAIEAFFERFNKDILEQKAYTSKVVDGEMVFESFATTAESAGALDGWHPKELILLSRSICDTCTIMLNQIEEGAPWPRSAIHARVVHLEKEGAAIGKVMSYRPFAITALIYRCWATMRLATLEEWIGPWALHEMYVGIP